MIKRSVAICAGSLLMLSSQAIAVNDKALDLLKKGYAECKSAHILRRQDFDQAKETYNTFLDLRDQAAAIDASILESANPEVTRIIGYCDTVGVDIRRTEALPVFQEGVAACDKSAEHLRNNEIEEARSEFTNYLELKAGAEDLSKAIVDVFSVKAEIRRCDRVISEIEIAEAKLDELKGALEDSLEYLGESLSMCQALTGKEVKSLELEKMKQGLEAFTNHRDSLPDQGLLQQEEVANLPITQKIESLNKKIEACAVTARANIKVKEKELIAAEEERKRLEELAKLEQQKLQNQEGETDEAGEPLVEETPEQKQERMSRNFEFYKLVKRVNPEFPSRALRTGREGYVVIEYNVNPEGKVVNPTIIESSPKHLFEKAALNAIRKWQYEAQFEDDEPDMGLARTRMSFSLSN